MTSFIDGPAKGKTLMLKRSPKYLRVVIDEAGKVDALDQLHDSPGENERVFAYRVHGEIGSVHLNMGRGRGGFYPLAEYRLIPTQPADSVLRKNEAWRAWTIATEADAREGAPV
jgi:hypothetical protein